MSAIMLTACGTPAAKSGQITPDRASETELSEAQKEAIRQEALANLPKPGSVNAISDEDREQAENEEKYVEGEFGHGYVEEVSQKDSYATFDEVIDYLTSGQGFSYVETGRENEKVLVVSDNIYQDDNGKNVSPEVYIYGMADGSIHNLGYAASVKSSYPVKEAQGSIYTGGPHDYQELSIDENTGRLFIAASLSEVFDSLNTASYIGQVRSEKSITVTPDYLDTMDDSEYDRLFVDYNSANIIEFTIIK